MVRHYGWYSNVSDFSVDRSKKPIDFLNDYRGYVRADAYSGCDELFRKEGIQYHMHVLDVRRSLFIALSGQEYSIEKSRLDNFACE